MKKKTIIYLIIAIAATLFLYSCKDCENGLSGKYEFTKFRTDSQDWVQYQYNTAWTFSSTGITYQSQGGTGQYTYCQQGTAIDIFYQDLTLNCNCNIVGIGANYLEIERNGTIMHMTKQSQN